MPPLPVMQVNNIICTFSKPVPESAVMLHSVNGKCATISNIITCEQHSSYGDHFVYIPISTVEATSISLCPRRHTYRGDLLQIGVYSVSSLTLLILDSRSIHIYIYIYIYIFIHYIFGATTHVTRENWITLQNRRKTGLFGDVLY